MIAPSSPFDPEAFARGLEVLSGRLGLVPRVRDDVTARKAYLAGDDARRIDEWREAVADREARAVFCARGGRPGRCQKAWMPFPENRSFRTAPGWN